MFDNNYQNAVTNNQNVSTHIDTLFSDQSYLKISVWNDKISLAWTPVVGVATNGKSMYSKDNTVKTALSHSKIETLLGRYNRHIKAKVDANEDPGEDGLCVGVTVKSGTRDNPSTSGVLIEYRRGTDGKNEVFLTLVKNLTSQGTSDIIRYKFNLITAIIGSDPNKGNFKEEYDQGELSWFLKLLDQHKMIPRYAEHGKRYAESFRTENGGNSGSAQMPNGGFDASAMAAPMNESADFSVFS